MRIKKFTAGSMREALMQIKNELGEEAIILKSRKLPKKVFSLGAQDEVEVTAAIDETAAPSGVLLPLAMKNTGVYGRPRVSNVIDPSDPGAPKIKPWRPMDDNLKHELRGIRQAETATIQKGELTENRQEQLQIMELKENIRELRDLVKTVLQNGSSAAAGGFTGGWAVLYKRLVDSEVNAAIATELIKEVSAMDILLSDVQAERKFTAALERILPVAGPLRLKKKGPLIVAFVGPTGSGKTTTLAKLAAHCRISKKKKISIITADTYRIAAIEQIRMFADIVKVGLQIIFSPDELPAALEACAEDDIVFVDTAGRSQRHSGHMDDIKEFLNALQADEIHLVLSATTKDSDQTDCVERYRPLGINRLLFTKLDETIRVGNILNVVHTSGLPVSYFTFGQSVPDDIEVAQTTRFVQRLWEGTVL